MFNTLVGWKNSFEDLFAAIVMALHDMSKKQKVHLRKDILFKAKKKKCWNKILTLISLLQQLFEWIGYPTLK